MLFCTITLLFPAQPVLPPYLCLPCNLHAPPPLPLLCHLKSFCTPHHICACYATAVCLGSYLPPLIGSHSTVDGTTHCPAMSIQFTFFLNRYTYGPSFATLVIVTTHYLTPPALVRYQRQTRGPAYPFRGGMIPPPPFPLHWTTHTLHYIALYLW